jgi:ATP-binding cassette subfamily B protein
MFELIREMLKLVPEMRRRLYLSAALKVIESLFISAPYGFLVLTLNDILSHTLSRNKVFFYTAGMAACFLLQGLFFYLYARTAYPLATKLGERIRIIVGEHLRKLSMSYFSNKTTGDLNALVSDELVIVGIIPRLAFPVFITGITLPMAFIPFLLFIDWRLALTTLVVVPLSMPFFKKNQKILRNGFDLRSKSLITISSKIIEYVQGLAEVKAFKQTGRQFTKFDDVLRKFKMDNLDLVIQSITPNMLYKTVLDFGFAMILMVGAYMFLGGKITLFTFLVFLIVGLRVYEPIKAMSTVFELVRIAEVTIGRVRTLLDTPLLPQPTNAVTPRAYDIEFRKVTFSYD